ncbi:hypothetical protein [Chitinolyticbacter albus]|uniref:hypothetical protein n=1 Tax=Chitinolyticbacter albus TaxID=2961951 RepID=UPI002108FD3B|nr:hypothetical protein [Chitinolyticbacter albus]
MTEEHVLPHDEALSRQYRALAEETPSPALDAAILAAAERATAPRRASRRWWPAWRISPQWTTACATLLLGGFVYTLWPSAQPERSITADTHKPAAHEQSDATPPRIAQWQPAPLPAPTSARAQQAARHREEAQRLAKAEHQAFDAARVAAREAEELASEKVSKQLALPAPAAAAPAASVMARSSEAELSAPLADMASSPQIDERLQREIRQIRQLLAVGRNAEAEHAWRRLTAVHPRHALPEDLRARWAAPPAAAGIGASQPAAASSASSIE